MSNKVLGKIEKSLCTGCSLCMNVCTVNAISMKLDENGFFFPVIDEKKCVNCGTCYNSCPAVYQKPNNNYNKPKAYATYSNNKEIIQNSSSGGIVSEIAQLFLAEKGVVYGVAWNSDNLGVSHIRIDNDEDLQVIRGSKYLQSYTGKIYSKVKSDIDDNRKVLFIGTPCQVAAIRKFIEHKNLYTIDLICHGVPSLSVFRSYIKENYKENIKKINFRYKKKGWSNFCLKVNEKITEHSRDPFFCGYLRNYFLNSSCYNCRFAKFPREGDITVGDYWGVPKELWNDNQGMSVIIINSIKGEEIVKQLKENKVPLISQPLNQIINGNLRLVNGRYKNYSLRNEILKDFQTNDFKYIKKKYIKIQPKLLIMLKRLAKKVLRK